jgi:lipopolysaccharide/colanic/teichoic acid biosynthesis glycosyltransferase
MSSPSLKPSDLMQQILPQDLFLGMICLERKRAERSRKRFSLLLLDAQDAIESDRHTPVLKALVKVVRAARRETDPAGWYKHEEVLGIIFTELGELSIAAVNNTLVEKVQQALGAELSADDLRLVRVSVHTFADGSDDQGSTKPVNRTFYPDLLHQQQDRKFSLWLKRVMDVLGSVLALVLLSPLFGLIALLVKLTSDGPVLFRQERVGQFCVPFELLKFRSMHLSNNGRIHENYVRTFIAGKAEPVVAKTSGNVVYKITDDPRVTRLGRFMRRTSLDELPQLWNVLKGEMSLVGPRPSLAYEIEAYDVWHKRRLLEAKPGITGLWQVRGRSRTTFAEMVRLDLRYSRTRSFLLDLKILLLTPRAVLSGDGAY